jgi:hypothetical protein
MTEIKKMSKKTGKTAARLSANAGEAFRAMMKGSGKKVNKLYGKKYGVDALKA